MTLLNHKIKFFAFVLTFVLLLVCSNESIFAQKKKKMPRFKYYPVTEIYKGKNAPLKLTRADKKFKTRLKEAVDNYQANFAGHYILTTWGCGTNCPDGAIIDARNGRVKKSENIQNRRKFNAKDKQNIIYYRKCDGCYFYSYEQD